MAKVDGQIVALGRSGYLAQSSPFKQHQLFAQWVRWQEPRFRELLADGERAVGEWLAQAHGTRYSLKHEPFVLFDIMVGIKRATVAEVEARAHKMGLRTPQKLHQGNCAYGVDAAMQLLSAGGFHGALDPVEGAVWRVERQGKVDFLAKYVRPGKADGIYLPEVSGKEAVWNWRPPKCMRQAHSFNLLAPFSLPHFLSEYFYTTRMSSLGHSRCLSASWFLPLAHG